MKILFLTNYYPPFEVGGYEQLCHDVAKRLAQRGHEIAVLTSDHDVESQHKDAVSDGVYRVLVIQPDYNHWLSPAWQFFLTRRRGDHHNRRWLRRVVEQVQPDVVFIWNLQGLTRWLAMDAEALPGVAIAYWLAGYSPAEPDEFWYYWSLQPQLRSHLGSIKAGMRHAAHAMMRYEGQPLQPAMHHVAVVSQFMRNKGIAEGTLPQHARVIYNGVEVEQFLRPVRARIHEPLRLLQAGRVTDDKGVHTAIEAVGYLVREHGLQDIHMTVAGSGRADYEARLHEIVQRLTLDDHVTMTGWLAREHMPALMAQSHVLLLPTTHPEAFARVVLEGMAGGLAVIAADTGGSSEIVQHEKTGLLFPANDSRRLAAEIMRLTQDDHLRQRLASAGQEVVRQQFNLDQMVDELEGLLTEALASCRPSA